MDFRTSILLRRACRKTNGPSRFAPGCRVGAYFRPQKVASGFTSSKPASQASWLRQTTWASALRPVSGWISRTRLCRGTSAPTTARHPVWLTSTVTALARSLAPPCSHSTWSFTREIMRLWVRSLSHRSCNAFAAALGAIVVVIGNLAVEYLPGPGGRSFTLVLGIAEVNSTFSPAPSWSHVQLLGCQYKLFGHTAGRAKQKGRLRSQPKPALLI